VKSLEQDFEIKALKTEILELKNQMKIKEIENLEKSSQNSQEFEVKQLRFELEFKERAIKDLKEELKLMKNQIKSFEKSLEKGGKNFDEKNSAFYQKKLEELKKEFFDEKKAWELKNSSEKEEKFVKESELARLSIENHNLLKQIKDFHNKSNKSKFINETSFSKENDDLKAKYKFLELELSDEKARIANFDVFSFVFLKGFLRIFSLKYPRKTQRKKKKKFMN